MVATRRYCSVTAEPVQMALSIDSPRRTAESGGCICSSLKLEFGGTHGQ
jgi:hypothetical protein